MKYERSATRPEIVCDQQGGKLIDADGNYIGWDGDIVVVNSATGESMNMSTQSQGRMVWATKSSDTRNL